MSTSERSAAVEVARAAIAARLEGLQPTVAIVLGSGLGPLADRIRDPKRIGYAEIPGFHIPSVEGHRGELVIGQLAGKAVIVQSGRFHMYEGHSADVSALPVRAFAALGVGTLIVTNAAGGINPEFGAGTIMLISDHLNLTGRTPLLGGQLPGEERFPDMTVAYDAGLRETARRIALEKDVPLAEGVYAGLLGPNYETPAEVRMVGRVGADAVGMSTVVEVIAARSRGVRCLGFSTVTNPAAGLSQESLSHGDVMEMAAQVGGRLGALVEGIVGATE